MRPNFLARPPVIPSKSSASSASASRCLVAAAPSGVPLCASAPPVRGLLRIPTQTRKRFFTQIQNFLTQIQKMTQNHKVTMSFFLRFLAWARILPPAGRPLGGGDSDSNGLSTGLPTVPGPIAPDSAP
uniref:Uncharacterized protein n=1 Tax=uncultured Rhodobacterales bacterium HF4000_03E16 TaxID=710785 RepID=E0XV91_9RHOB|nr:hypothetical protein [uncultured Rhodobacterales bacterium HF4000_03E16]